MQNFHGHFSGIIQFHQNLVIEHHLQLVLLHIILELIFLLQKEQIYILYVLELLHIRGFYGADGYSIIIENTSENLQIIYGHVSPDFIVSVNQTVKETEKIGTVGPKYVESSENTKYYENGVKTNGSTTGCHLHLTIKKDGVAVDPLDYL